MAEGKRWRDENEEVAEWRRMVLNPNNAAMMMDGANAVIVSKVFQTGVKIHQHFIDSRLEGMFIRVCHVTHLYLCLCLCLRLCVYVCVCVLCLYMLT